MTSFDHDSRPAGRVRRHGPARLLTCFTCLGAFALLAAAPFAHGIGLDPAFGAGRGYVPVAAAEPQIETAAGIARIGQDEFVILGRRIVGTRGVVLLERYGSDATLDKSFGDQGTLTLDIPGESLLPKAVAVQPDGRLLVAAASDAAMHVWGLLPSGAADTAFGDKGALVLPLAAGAGAGASSFHLLNSGAMIVVLQNAPAASLGLTLYRYSANGIIDPDFGTRGKLVLTSLAAGYSYAGVGATLADDRVVIGANNDGSGARALVTFGRDGFPDPAFGSGGVIAPAALQGKALKRIAPLVSNFFLVAATGGTAGAFNSSVTRFDPAGRVDTQFASGTGTLQITAAGATSIAVADVFEQVDNALIVTGSAPEGLVVARYLQRGVPELSFNNGNGPIVVPEPAARATTGVATISFGGARLVHFGTGTSFGPATNAAGPPSRAFFIGTLDGVLDIGYGGKGIVSAFGRKLAFGEIAQQVLPLPDGRVMVLSSTGIGDGFRAILSRFLTDGTADASFGTGGRASFIRNGRCEWPLALALQADGKVLVMSTSFDNVDCSGSAIVAKRFTTTGIEDSFSLAYTGFVLRAKSGGITVQADGGIVVTGQDDRSLLVTRHLSSGFADTAFGSGGRVLWQRSPADDAKGGAVLIQSDQKIVAAGSMNGTQLVLLRLNPSGSPDLGFGTSGVAITPVPGASILEVQAIASTPAGKLLVLARSGKHPVLAQFTLAGALDASFGNGGTLLLLPVFVGGAEYARFGMTVQGDGGIVVSGQTTDNAASDVALMRVSPAGAADPTFGPSGLTVWRPSAYFAAGGHGVAGLPNGNGSLMAIGYGLPGAFLARFGSAPAIPAASVIEFYNTGLNHYFITADPAEQSAIDGGGAGPGWMRTGLGFHAYTTALGIPAGQSPVCRFYGSTAIDPATGLRRGPNSHFYTAQPAECAAVQLDPGWTLEGFAFHTQQPAVGGACAAGRVPVYRNYNKRAQFNDSNHRYTTDFATYQSMVALGWVAEGVVFCAAP